VLDYEILGMRSLRSLRVFQLSFAHALTVGRASWPPPRGRTPLHLAVLEGRDEVVALLLRSGASAEAKDTYGRRPQSCRSHGTVSGRRADDKLHFLVPSHSEESKMKQNEGRLVQVDPFPVSA